MPPDEEELRQTKVEYIVLLTAFRKLYDMLENSAESWEVIEEVISLRAAFLIDRALTGLRIDFDQALDLLRGHNDFISERERQERDLLVAAIDNLIDFAAAEETKMLKELPEERYADGVDIHESIFEKYNLHYATGENRDVIYAAGIAAWWISQPDNSILSFMTQSDERVRPWHLSLEGLSFPKKDFPPDLIPPIEYGCRCFLIPESYGSIYGSIASTVDYKKQVNPVFCDSLATGGRIFSGAHPYFQTPLPDKVKEIVFRIKSKFYLP